MSGTQSGEFMGLPPSGKHVEFTGMYMVRIQAGRLVEHWGEEDRAGLMQQLRTLKISGHPAEAGGA
jgi:predicted ester cyclase